MITNTFDNDSCPQCGNEMGFVHDIYGADADGNRGIGIDVFNDTCNFCGWSDGEEVIKCDNCGELMSEVWFNEESDLLCTDCRD
jgi:hypothetical protein